MMNSGIYRPGIQDGDSATLQDLTVTGLLTAGHIHGGIAGNLYIHVRNLSGGELVAGTAVYALGTVGDTDIVQVSACDPTNPAKMPAIGLLETTLANNGDGNAVVVGELRPFNTAGFTIGDQLYVGASGAPTATVPTSGEVQSIGSVVRVNSETGTVLVQISAALAKVAVSGAYADLSGTPTVPAPADATPQPLGVAAIGSSADYAREDHVHAMPGAGDVGAALAGAIGSSGLTMSAGLLGRETGTGAIGVFSIGSGLAVVGGALVVTAGGTGTVTSVGLTVPTGLTVSGSPITTSGTLAISLDVGYSIPTTASQGNWDTAYSERLQWDGGSTGLNAGTGRTSLGLGGAAVLNVGTTAGTVAAGDDARFHDAVTLGASVADVLDLTGQVIGADDPGADRILFWDDSEGKLRHLALGGGLVIDGTTLTVPVEIGLACSDETTDLTTGAGKVTFRLPHAMTLTAVRASVTTAPTGSTLVVDINEGGTSVLSTKLSIDAGEKTSTTAAVPAVISDSSLADDAEITIDIDQIGADPLQPGAGLKVWLIGRRA